MSWDYADLSKKAKLFGGPERMLESLVQDSKSMGKREMIPSIIGVAALGTIGGWIGHKIYSKRKKKNDEKVNDRKSAIVKFYEEALKEKEEEYLDVDGE